MSKRGTRAWRGVLSLVLALALVAGLVPVQALAEALDGEDAVDVEEVELGADGTDAGIDAIMEIASESEEPSDAVDEIDQVEEDDIEAALEEGPAAVVDEAAACDELRRTTEEDDIGAALGVGHVAVEEEGEGPVLEVQSVSVRDPLVVADPSMEAEQRTTWDCVWFGSYPQTEVTPEDAAYASLQDATYDSRGDATVGGDKYRRISKSDTTFDEFWHEEGYGSATYRYFRYEPIKWRVLEANGSEALVVADVALDGKCFNTIATDVTWETSSVRSWLNGYGAGANEPDADYSGKNFVDSAFTSVQKSAILQTTVVTEDNPYYGTVGGNDTSDKVFLLSLSDMRDRGGERHGFSNWKLSGEDRRCEATDYAHAMGAWRSTDAGYEGNCWWWLRSPGIAQYRADYVDYDGFVRRHGLYDAQELRGAIRPALNLDLTSPTIVYAGTVCSDGTGDEQVAPGSDEDGSNSNYADPRVVADSSMVARQRTTWNCMWFGSYPQTEVTSADAVYADLQDATYNSKGDTTVGGARYRRISKSDATDSGCWRDDGYGSATYRYFRYEPIKWRVLEANGSEALVIADIALDDKPFNLNSYSPNERLTWERSSVRSWLNGYGAGANEPGVDFSSKSFINTAFTSAQKSAILQTTVVTEDNPNYGTVGGNDTSDKVFLLSLHDISSEAGRRRGFSAWRSPAEDHRCKVTDYGRAMGAWRSTDAGYEGNCWWWLRSPGIAQRFVDSVNYDGLVRRHLELYMDSSDGAIRPALNVDLTSPAVAYAGTVCSDGTSDERSVPSLLGSDSMSDYDISNALVASISDQTYTGSALEPAPIVTLDGVTLVAGTDYAVSYVDNVDAGTATVVITGAGDYEGMTTGSFDILRATPVITAADKSVVMGGTVALGATTTGDGALTYRSSDASIVVVSPAGVVTPVKDGTAEVTISSAETRNYEAASRTVTVTVMRRGDSTVRLAAQTMTYTGKVLSYSGTVTKTGSSGEVTYAYFSDAACTRLMPAADVRNVGTYYVRATVAADADYEAATSDAVKLTITKAASTIKLAAQGKTYTGNPLTYTGTVTKTGSNGKVTYAYFSDDACTKEVTASNVKDAGTYYVRATVAADANHKAATSDAVKLTVAKASSAIALAAQTRTYTGKVLAYTGKVARSGSAGKVTYRYFSDAKCTKAIKAANVKAAGTYYVRATLAADANHKAAASKVAKLTVAKAKNSIAAKAIARAAKLVTVKKKAVAVTAPLSVTKAQGKVTYAKVSGNAGLSINKATGKVTVKKGTKKGVYTIKVKATAAGDANHKAGYKTVACTVTVK